MNLIQGQAPSQKMNAQIVYLLNQNKELLADQDAISLMQMINNFQEAIVNRTSHVLDLMLKTYNLVKLLEQIKLIDLTIIENQKQTETIDVNNLIELISESYSQIYNKVYKKDIHAQFKEALDQLNEDSDIEITPNDKDEGKYELEINNCYVQEIKQFHENKVEIDYKLQTQESSIMQFYQENSRHNPQSQSQQKSKNHLQSIHSQIKYSKNDDYSSLDQSSSQSSQKIMTYRDKQMIKVQDRSSNSNLHSKTGSQHNTVLYSNPELTAYDKPINFYMVRKIFQDRKIEVTAQISRDLNAYRQCPYTLYLYNSNRQDIIVGIVYVHSKIWPKYVTFLKGVKQNRVGQEEYYVCNKESSLRNEFGKNITPQATVQTARGPFDIVSL
ncbi:UNKNOWN [Stylonychia lemnae]|uniref:Uncharacterized protein n=1 Tax=Stylonychia lemnae TaxID=5949 RepID=A0A078B425_STYLE|nr:UNKNOWN [Stylonychia lemnae]|eukprot:CDW88263.1 UNKNOWN [Stylonychia lemnae]